MQTLSPMKLFSSIGLIKKATATYRLGLLQAKAYRILKQRTTEYLFHLDISTIDWALLGLLYDNQKGIRLKKIADDLGVEAAFVTSLVKSLKQKQLVQIDSDSKDQRAKLLKLTEKGLKLVPGVEQELRHLMRPLVSGATPKQLLSYLVVLEQIIQNAEKSMNKKPKYSPVGIILLTQKAENIYLSYLSYSLVNKGVITEINT